MQHDAETIVVYHASPEVVRVPQWDYIPPDKTLEMAERKDFGLGFYTCLSPEYPIALCSSKNDKCVVTKYALTLTDLKIARLVNDIKWLLVISAHRCSPGDFQKWQILRDKVYTAIAEKDIIIGTISNDNFFTTFDRFLVGRYTDAFTIKIAQIMNYPVQYVLKSDDACKQIEYLSHEEIDASVVAKHKEGWWGVRGTPMKERIKEIENAAKADGTLYEGEKFKDIVERMVKDDFKL